jgi:hypothetical protein
MIVVLVGCGTAPATSALVSPGGGQFIKDPCQDPTADCPPTNGTGVYGAEGGDIGIDTFKLLITHFVNKQGSPVTFQGRYRDAAANRWQPLAEPGVVNGADYQNRQYRVVSVTETGTEPTWTLQPTQPANAPLRQVTGAELAGLELHIMFLINRARNFYALTFTAPADVDGKHLVHTYQLRWTREIGPVTGPSGPPSQGAYCRGAGADGPEPVVFQQTIAVAPDTGKVLHNPSTKDFVTMSCLGGAIAKVYNKYGYPYRGPDANAEFYFGAAIQMKRASYCADAHHYTFAGTKIYIADDQSINTEAVDKLEASWTPDGATCVNKQNLRHPELKFSGICNGQPLPACSAPGQLGDAPADQPAQNQP